LPVDVMAGLTIWALMVPQAMAYAGIAGVPVQNGLDAMPLAVVGYALFGTSRHLFVGPSATVATLSASSVALVATASTGSSKYIALTAALTLLVGVIYVVGGLARLGFVARFFAQPVLAGFIVGLGLYIAIGQLPKVVGIKKPSGDTLLVLVKTIGHVGSWGWSTVAVGLICLLALFALARLAPKLPGVIIVVIVAVLATKVFGLQHHGVAIVGNVPTGFQFVSLSSVAASNVVHLLPGALAIVIVGLAQSLAIAKSYAANYKYSIDANREMLGYGAANIGTGLLQGLHRHRRAIAVSDGRARRCEVPRLLPRHCADGAAHDPLSRRVVRRPARGDARRDRHLGGVGDDRLRPGHAVPTRAVAGVLGGAWRSARVWS
jgi:SulP family sulfate permease